MERIELQIEKDRMSVPFLGETAAKPFSNMRKTASSCLSKVFDVHEQGLQRDSGVEAVKFQQMFRQILLLQHDKGVASHSEVKPPSEAGVVQDLICFLSVGCQNLQR